MKKAKKLIKKMDLSCCLKCWNDLTCLSMQVIINVPDGMTLLEISSDELYGNRREVHACNFFTDCRFRSDEYARLVFLVSDFKTAQGTLDNVQRRFNNLMEYISVHCDFDRTMNEISHRCKCLPEILVNSLNMKNS